jgi:hypothetical protein
LLPSTLCLLDGEAIEERFDGAVRVDSTSSTSTPSASPPRSCHKTGLLGTYVVWLLLLAAMAWPCAWYYRRRAGRRAAG